MSIGPSKWILGVYLGQAKIISFSCKTYTLSSWWFTYVLLPDSTACKITPEVIAPPIFRRSRRPQSPGIFLVDILEDELSLRKDAWLELHQRGLAAVCGLESCGYCEQVLLWRK